jgi:hypothetical protein
MQGPDSESARYALSLGMGIGIFPEREEVFLSSKRVGSIGRCLICDGMFTSTQAADHGATPCYPHSEASDDSRTHNR